ncbi:MAG TPA: hypothetical protein VGP36_00920 [Mycobacteriales bacterium]|jgi:hypothetical protein|nr:hypothetical protein [Mycobacteriales bacterium]
MTEWDGHDHGPGHDHDPSGWEAPEPTGFDGHAEEPGTVDDPYGHEVGSAGPYEPAAADPDEPAGLPPEAPADWSATPLHDGLPAADPGDRIDGTDPAGWTDATAESDPFPPALDMDVGPADGGPWVDPDLLGGSGSLGDPAAGPADPPEALLSDLAAADGNPDADWSALADSDDPAVRALTRHWT